MATGVPKSTGTDLPWSNCRLLLASEADEDADLPQGIVGRLYFSPVSHPAVRQSWQGLTLGKLSVPALAVQNLVNRRGPDALVGRIPGEKVHSLRLLELCNQCHESGQVLICSIPAGDVVLVPRVPAAAEQDGLYFIAYATNIRAVELCESLRSLKQVAIVLDIDNTLIDATPEHLDEEKLNALQWREISVESSSGRKIQGHLAHVEPSCCVSETEERAFIIHWQVGRMSCTFRVRVRPGWAAFRQFLLLNTSRFAPFVCSKGKLEYVQLIWSGLDIDDIDTTDSISIEDTSNTNSEKKKQLIPREMWNTHITSTFPDTLARAAQKTALVSVGCADVLRPLPPTQLAAPIIFLDDSPEAYDPEYSNSILYVEEYRPSDDVHTDRGSVLSQVCTRLETYYNATCGEAGTFAWQAAQSFATAILGAMQKTPMESPDALAYLQVRCTKQGFALWHQITVASVFNDDVYIADLEDEGNLNGNTINHEDNNDDSNINNDTGDFSMDIDSGGVSSGVAIPIQQGSKGRMIYQPRPFPFSPMSSPQASPSSSPPNRGGASLMKVSTPPKHFLTAAAAAGVSSGPGSRRTSVDEQIHPLLKEGSLSEFRGAMAARLAAAQAAEQAAAARGGAKPAAVRSTAASYVQQRQGTFSRSGSGGSAGGKEERKNDSKRNISDDIINADLMMKC